MGLVQSNGATNDGSATSISVAFLSDVTAGSRMVAGISFGTAPRNLPTSVADSQGTTWTLVDSSDDSTASQNQAVYEALAKQTGACTVTVTWGESHAFRRIVIAEISGTTTRDQHGISTPAVATTATNNVTSPSVTTTHDSQTVVGIVMDTSGAATETAGTGYTKQQGVGELALETKTQTTKGAVAATWTFSAADRYVAAIITYYAASASRHKALSIAPSIAPSIASSVK